MNKNSFSRLNPIIKASIVLVGGNIIINLISFLLFNLTGASLNGNYALLLIVPIVTAIIFISTYLLFIVAGVIIGKSKEKNPVHLVIAIIIAIIFGHFYVGIIALLNNNQSYFNSVTQTILSPLSLVSYASLFVVAFIGFWFAKRKQSKKK